MQMRNEEALNYIITLGQSGIGAYSPYHEALQIARDAISKTIPLALYVNSEMLQCPYCHRNITPKSCTKKMYGYCPKCGQRLDWSSRA